MANINLFNTLTTRLADTNAGKQSVAPAYVYRPKLKLVQRWLNTAS